jgi:6,7-dimethyl-8-ribityllumazine synthase
VRRDDDAPNVVVIVARYNQEVTRRLLRGALDVLRDEGVPEPEVHWVPGVLDIPVAALALAERGVDAVTCLSCVIGAEVPDFVAGECASGIMQVQLETGVPCTLGVLVALDKEQALAASGPKNNRGRDAAEAALEMTRVLGAIQEG